MSAVVLTQLIFSALALTAVLSGGMHTTWVTIFVSMCFLVGLLTLVWLSVFAKDGIDVADSESTSQDNVAALELIGAKRKIAELHAELENARKDIWELKQFKSDFLGHISHEIRTPLNAVVGMAELLSRTELSKEQSELVSLVSSSGETLLSVINDILNYSKIESGEFSLDYSEFELYDLVEGTTALLAEQARLKEITLTTFISPVLARSYIGDPGRLKQILLNLLGNAVRFAQKGELLVAATQDPTAPDRLRFSVKDNSSSMSTSVVASLFTPMTEVDMITTRKYGGTGLGLSVSKKLVELMKGEIGVESHAEKGTTYWFSAAVRPAPEYHGSTPSAPLSEELPIKKILLLGKASSSMAVVMAYCKSWGVQAEYEPLADAALASLYAAPQNYQAVVVEPSATDTNPVLFLDKLFHSDELAEVHVIVLTDDEQTEQAVKKLGFTLQTLRKPFKKAHLREALRHCHLKVRRTGELVPESELKSFLASVQFATNKSQTEQLEEHKKPAPGQSRIMIVEDNPVNRRLVLLQLKTLGMDCHIVENGQEAVDVLQKDDYDLVFMDCWMPVLDGFGATKKIREIDLAKRRHTPIVAMTANAMETDRQECLAAGMDDYISKPVTRTVLQSMLDKWLPAHGELQFDTKEPKESKESTEPGSDSDSPPKRSHNLNTNTWS